VMANGTIKNSSAIFHGPFQRGLDICVTGPRIALAWIDWEYGVRENICSKIVEDGDVVSHQRTPLRDRAPKAVKSRIMPDGRIEVFWTAFRDGTERLFHAFPERKARLVTAFSDRHCGDFVVVSDTSGTITWLAVQVWDRGSPAIELWRRDAETWNRLDLVRSACGFASHPALSISRNGALVLVWSEHEAGSAVLRGVIVEGEGRPEELESFAFDGHLASHPAVVADGHGNFFLSCCLERLVRAEHGEAGYHSCIVTALLDKGQWQINGESCIDYAMNPWMAGYAGRRRTPSLVANPDGGAWVLFEEKIDPETMSPGPGRLILRAVGDVTEKVLLTCNHEYHVAPGLLPDGRIAVASLTQELRYERVPPQFRLSLIKPDAPMEIRPPDLLDNATAPPFSVCVNRDDSRPQHENFQLFFGDPHLHSTLSGDLEGDQEELYSFARDTAKLDFVAFTDNDYAGFTHPMTAAAWEQSRRNAEFFNEPGRFTAFVGWEYTQHSTPFRKDALNSHRCIIFPGGDGPFHSWLNPETGGAPDLARRLHGQRVLLHHHHPSGYDISDDSVECNIEVCSGWWNCMWIPEFVQRLHGLLDAGFRLGFIGGSDNHERNPGLGGALTGVWAEDNTREAIFEAFQQRRVFATTGLRPDVRFRVADIFMGGTGETDGDPLVQLSVRCEVPVRSIRIIRDGHQVHEQVYENENAVNLQWRDMSFGKGPHWYYAHIIFAGHAAELPWNRAPAQGVDAWTSPVWVYSGGTEKRRS